MFSLTKVRNTTKILFVDGHYSHISIETIDLAIENNIVLICLPPHTTHILQPLDVSVFKPVKSAWKKVIDDYFKRTNYQSIDKKVFPSLVNELYQKAFKKEHAISGFVKTGLFPLDGSKITDESLGVSIVFRNADQSNLVENVRPSTSNSNQTATSLKKRQTRRLKEKDIVDSINKHTTHTAQLLQRALPDLHVFLVHE